MCSFLGEGPVLENGTVVRWHVSWNPKRIFPIDMLGFAINSSMIGPGRPLQGRESTKKHQPFGECNINREFWASYLKPGMYLTSA